MSRYETYCLLVRACNETLASGEAADENIDFLKEYRRKQWLHALDELGRESDDDDYRQMRLRTAINTHRFRGAFGKMWVNVYIWSRDCDMCEGDEVALIPGTLEAYEKTVERMWKDAEGPFSIYPVSREFAKNFKPTSRDRVLEAFEDGHPHCITL